MPQSQATSCRTSQTCTLLLACRRPVSKSNSGRRGFSEGRNANVILPIFPGLRRDYNSTPVSRCVAEPSATFPSYFDETTQIKSGPSLSSCWRSDVPSLNPPRRSLSSSESQRGCQSPKLSRLQQQVTQFKLLKLAQNQGDCLC